MIPFTVEKESLYFLLISSYLLYVWHVKRKYLLFLYILFIPKITHFLVGNAWPFICSKKEVYEMINCENGNKGKQNAFYLKSYIFDSLCVATV